jgi:hypothetical protein
VRDPFPKNVSLRPEGRPRHDVSDLVYSSPGIL